MDALGNTGNVGAWILLGVAVLGGAVGWVRWRSEVIFISVRDFNTILEANRDLRIENNEYRDKIDELLKRVRELERLVNGGLK